MSLPIAIIQPIDDIPVGKNLILYQDFLRSFKQKSPPKAYATRLSKTRSKKAKKIKVKCILGVNGAQNCSQRSLKSYFTTNCLANEKSAAKDSGA